MDPYSWVKVEESLFSDKEIVIYEPVCSAKTSNCMVHWESIKIKFNT